MNRTLGLFLCLVLLVTAGTGVVGAQPDASPTSDREAIGAVLAELLARMRIRDSAAVLATMTPEAPIVRIQDDGTVSTTSGEDFAAALAEMPFEPHETMPERIAIDIDGAFATARGAYEFHRGDVYSHCGVNVFHLARGVEGWRVAAIVYSAREVCGGAGITSHE